MENFESEKIEGGSKKLIFVVIAIVILGALVIGAYYLMKKSGDNRDNVPIDIASTVAPSDLDSDSDTIPDLVESAIGTNPEKMDTDGDGFDDLAEIKSGYSPLIAGGAGKYTPEEWQAVKDEIKAADEKYYEKEFGKKAGTFQEGQMQSYCKLPDGYIQETYQPIFSAENIKRSIDFKIYVPTYIPLQIKQLCPIESEKVQAGYRIINISFYSENTNTEKIQDYLQLPKPKLSIIENNRKEEEVLSQQAEKFKEMWDSDEIKIGSLDALFLTYKPEALKSNSILQMKLKTDSNIANTKIIKLFIGDTFIDIQSDLLSKEDLVKLTESLIVL